MKTKTVGGLIFIIPYVDPYQSPDDFLSIFHISIVSVLEEGISEALDQRLLMSSGHLNHSWGMRISDPLFLGFSVPYSSKFYSQKKGRENIGFIFLFLFAGFYN